jgi:hypothetical protein
MQIKSASPERAAEMPFCDDTATAPRAMPNSPAPRWGFWARGMGTAFQGPAPLAIVGRPRWGLRVFPGGARPWSWTIAPVGASGAAAGGRRQYPA